jgi:hypothetical protein
MRRSVKYLILAIVVIVLLKVLVWLIIPFLPWLFVLVALIIILGSLVNRRLPF